MEETVYKRSVVVEEIGEVELRSLCSPFFLSVMTEIIIETWNLTKSNSIQVLHNRI